MTIREVIAYAKEEHRVALTDGAVRRAIKDGRLVPIDGCTRPYQFSVRSVEGWLGGGLPARPTDSAPTIARQPTARPSQGKADWDARLAQARRDGAMAARPASGARDWKAEWDKAFGR